MRWTDFFVTAGGAAAALTGLLFVAVALRPREIRESALMVGRARSAFYSFVTVLLIALLALAGTASRLIGLALVAIAGLMRAFQGVRQSNEVVLASGVLVLLGIALSNSWQLVLSHQ